MQSQHPFACSVSGLRPYACPHVCIHKSRKATPTPTNGSVLEAPQRQLSPMPLHTYRGLSIYHQSICLQREDTDSSLEAAPSEALYTYAEEYDGARSGTIPAQSVSGHTGRPVGHELRRVHVVESGILPGSTEYRTRAGCLASLKDRSTERGAETRDAMLAVWLPQAP